jgi:hypothetical protein
MHIDKQKNRTVHIHVAPFKSNVTFCDARSINLSDFSHRLKNSAQNQSASLIMGERLGQIDFCALQTHFLGRSRFLHKRMLLGVKHLLLHDFGVKIDNLQSFKMILCPLASLFRKKPLITCTLQWKDKTCRFWKNENLRTCYLANHIDSKL